MFYILWAITTFWIRRTEINWMELNRLIYCHFGSDVLVQTFGLKDEKCRVIDGPNIERTNFYFLPDHVDLRI